jgi:protoporphyrinogen oxidase
VVLTASGGHYSFDKLIFTLPFFNLKQLYSQFPSGYMEKINSNPYLGAVNLVLALKQSFLKKDYWLNINDRRMPFLAIVEHTNMISPEYYAGDRLVYIGNYLSRDHRYFSLTANELLREFLPHLQKIHPGFNLNWVRKSWVWKNTFAQQVVGRNYARLIPPVSSPVAGFYVANMQQVYPWDRGTNYAVELGQKAADLCLTA